MIRIKEEKLNTLCSHCYHGQVIHGSGQQRVVYCAWLSEKINFPVNHCTLHKSKDYVRLGELENQATIITLGRTIGFHAPGTESHKNITKKGYDYNIDD